MCITLQNTVGRESFLWALLATLWLEAVVTLTGLNASSAKRVAVSCAFVMLQKAKGVISDELRQHVVYH